MRAIDGHVLLLVAIAAALIVRLLIVGHSKPRPRTIRDPKVELSCGICHAELGTFPTIEAAVLEDELHKLLEHPHFAESQADS